MGNLHRPAGFHISQEEMRLGPFICVCGEPVEGARSMGRGICSACCLDWIWDDYNDTFCATLLE
ncbi:MAG TPA: hypothetical protein VKS79_21060 [Gemmataceae bacterium]|nr:hypothetical protein [Gemmataceae bacterium]